MKITLILTVLLLYATVHIESRKMSSRSRSSSSRSSSSRRTGSNPAPTSLSNPQPSAAKPSLFGWQETAARPAQKQSNKQSHSYPSSQTGLSGNNPPKQQTTYQESIQRNNAPNPVQQIPQTNIPQYQGNQFGHSYPASNGLSGNSKPGALSGSGAGYPQNQNLAGVSGNGYPKQQVNNLPGQNAAPPPYSAVDPNRAYSGGHGVNNIGSNYYHPQGPPPPYSSFPQSYGGYGGHGYNPGYGSQAPGYFGNYVNHGKGFGGMSRTGSALTGVGIAGAGVGTILTGLALWNLARSTGHQHHTVIYDNRGQPVAVAPGNSTEPVVDPVLGDLVNCTLTINNNNASEVLAIPCAIATSFTPNADVKDPHINNNENDDTECIITVVTKADKQFTTTIPCSILLSTAASNNVTEAPILEANININNGTLIPLHDSSNNQPLALKLSTDNVIDYNNTNVNCVPELGDVRDPINPCFTIGNNLTVIPLATTEKSKVGVR